MLPVLRFYGVAGNGGLALRMATTKKRLLTNPGKGVWPGRSLCHPTYGFAVNTDNGFCRNSCTGYHGRVLLILTESWRIVPCLPPFLHLFGKRFFSGGKKARPYASSPHNLIFRSARCVTWCDALPVEANRRWLRITTVAPPRRWPATRLCFKK